MPFIKYPVYNQFSSFCSIRVFRFVLGSEIAVYGHHAEE